MNINESRAQAIRQSQQLHYNYQSMNAPGYTQQQYRQQPGYDTHSKYLGNSLYHSHSKSPFRSNLLLNTATRNHNEVQQRGTFEYDRTAQRQGVNSQLNTITRDRSYTGPNKSYIGYNHDLLNKSEFYSRIEDNNDHHRGVNQSQMISMVSPSRPGAQEIDRDDCSRSILATLDRRDSSPYQHGSLSKMYSRTNNFDCSNAVADLSNQKQKYTDFNDTRGYRTHDLTNFDLPKQSQYEPRMQEERVKSMEKGRRSRFNTPFLVNSQQNQLRRDSNQKSQVLLQNRQHDDWTQNNGRQIQSFTPKNQGNDLQFLFNSRIADRSIGEEPGFQDRTFQQPSKGDKDNSFYDFENRNSILKNSIDQYEQNQKIIERAQKLIQDNTMRMNQSSIEQSNQFQQLDLSSNWQGQKKQKERYDNEQSNDPIELSGVKSNWKPNMTQYSQLHPDTDNRQKYMVIQEQESHGRSQIVQGSKQQDGDEIRIESKLFDSVKDQSISYNQRHQKYIDKLKEIEDKLLGMNPGSRGKSKSKSKSRTRVLIQQSAPEGHKQLKEVTPSVVNLKQTEQDQVLPAVAQKTQDSSESIVQDYDNDVKLKLNKSMIGLDQEITSINGQPTKKPEYVSLRKSVKSKKAIVEEYMQASPEKNVSNFQDMNIDGVDILVQPQLTETPAQLQTPVKSKHVVQQSMLSSVSKNPRKVRGEVHLSQNQLQIERNERTPLNKKAKVQIVENSQAKAQQEANNWVNDEDNVLMLSPNPSVHHGQAQKDQEFNNLMQNIANEDNKVFDSQSNFILPQKIHQTKSYEKKNDDYSDYSSKILKQKLESNNLKNHKMLEQKSMKVSPFRLEKQDIAGKKVQKHRIVILGDENVGKTCLFLRYMYFDKSKSIQIQETPNKDGHIFTKTIVGKQFIHEYEIWDFMSQDELEEKQVKGSQQYDIFEQNQDYINWADVILLVFDVQDLGSFKHCQEIGEKLKRSKKVIYVANKCDNTDIEASQKLQDAQLCNRHLMMTVSSKNTFGLKNLFTEIDGEFANDFVEATPETHSLNKQKFDSILVLKSDQQETISLQLAYLSFRVDMRFHEDILQKQMTIRSIKGSKQLQQIKNLSQLLEIKQKANQMNNNISRYLLMAVNEELTNTVEFEYASLKQAQLTQIEEQIAKQIKAHSCKSTFLNAVLVLFTVVAFLQAFKYFQIEKPMPETLKWQESMIEAEKNIFAYQKQQINEAIKQVKAHTDLLENYENNVSKNLETLKMYSKVSVDKMDKQIYLLDRMVKNKLALTQSSLFDSELQNQNLKDVKLIEQNMKSLGYDYELLNFVQLSKAKIEYDSQINELRVQGVMLKDATQMIYKSYDNYINIFIKQNDPNADQWFVKQHEQFNFKLQEALRRFSQDAAEAESLKLAISALNDPFINSLSVLQKASQNQVSLPLPEEKLKQKCQIACGIAKTSACSIVDQSIQKLNNLEQEPEDNQLTSSSAYLSAASVSSSPKSRLDTLLNLDTDTGNLVDESTKRELQLRNLDISNIGKSQMGSSETKLFQAYTTSACSALLPEEQYSDTYKEAKAAFIKQQSEAFSTLSYTLMLLALLFTIAFCCNRSKKQRFFERETGADDTDITAELNGSQRLTTISDQENQN